MPASGRISPPYEMSTTSSTSSEVFTPTTSSSADTNPFSILDELPPNATEPPHESDDNEEEEVDSLPSEESNSSLEEDEEDERYDSDAEREWRESLQQLELMLTIVVVPYIGKYFGRKCAYWGWAKFMEWKHPNLEVVVTNPKLFKAAGAVEAASAL